MSTGIVNKEVDAAKPFLQGPNSRYHRVRVTQVYGTRYGAPTGRSDFGDRLLKLVGGTRQESDAHAVRGKLACDSAANSPAATCDNPSATAQSAGRGVDYVTHTRAASY